MPAWKFWLGTVCAFGLGLLFVVAGAWKLSDPLATSARMVQALIPAKLATATALAAGIVEIWAGILLIVPRWRRWGALLTGLMLLAFMVYFAVFYNDLRGADCSCFPWLKRVVGPEFFIGDTIMLVMAVVAYLWASRSEGWKMATIPLAAIAVFGLVVYGVALARQSGLQAPPSILVDGKSQSIQHGRVFLYFFDPQCAHCAQAAKDMAGYKWDAVEVIAIPTANPQWGQDFLNDAKLNAKLSSDVDKLRGIFKFTDPPYAVALEHGRQVQPIAVFEGDEPSTTLRRLGWIQ